MVESLASVLANYLLPYFILSLFAMLIAEVIAAVFRHRALVLRRFICGMLDVAGESGMTEQFYKHPLIQALSTGRYLPSYIPSHLFAVVVTDILRRRTPPEEDLATTASVTRLAGLSTTYGFLGRGDMHVALQRWFNDVMDGASGFYRLRTLALLFPIATAMVVSVDFDAIRIANYVGGRDALEKASLLRIQAQAKGDTSVSSDGMARVLASLDSIRFPLGWRVRENFPNILAPRETKEQATRFNPPQLGLFERILLTVMDSLLGMTISVLAIVLAAPFLFDLLNRFMIVRSTVKPVDSIPSLADDAPAMPASIAAERE